MSIVVRYSPKNLTAAEYNGVNEKLMAQVGQAPPEGMVMHVCFGDDGNLKISEIWESREQWQAFGEKLNPILEQAGAEAEGPPEVFEITNLMKA